MRKGLFIAGIVVLVIGVLCLVGGYLVVSAPSSVTISCGSAGCSPVGTLSTNGVSGATLSVSWSGADPSTAVYFTTVGNAAPTCSSPTGVVGHGSGASGSFSASMTSGTNYYLYACGPASSAVTLSYTAVGLSYLMLIGIVLLVIGAIITVLGFRAKARAPAPAPPEEEVGAAEPAPYAVPEPITSTSAPEPTREPIGVRATPPEPVRFMPASAPEPSSNASSPPAPGQERPMKVCAKCGTVNEPWITNCRKCKRPLGSTATS